MTVPPIEVCIIAGLNLTRRDKRTGGVVGKVVGKRKIRISIEGIQLSYRPWVERITVEIRIRWVGERESGNEATRNDPAIDFPTKFAKI